MWTRAPSPAAFDVEFDQGTGPNRPVPFLSPVVQIVGPEAGVDASDSLAQESVNGE